MRAVLAPPTYSRALPKLSFEIIPEFLSNKYDTCNSRVHVSSIEKYIVAGSQSLLLLFLVHRGAFLGLEGVL